MNQYYIYGECSALVNTDHKASDHLLESTAWPKGKLTRNLA